MELGREVGPGGHIVGIDESPEMLEAARARIARERLSDRVEVRHGDAARLDFPAATFDFVTAVQVYLYVADVAGALRKPRVSFAPAVAWRSSTPTGTPACGSRPTGTGIAG